MSINGLNPLSYIGVDSPNPAAQIVTMNQDPTVNDSLNFTLGDIWINRNTLVPDTESIFMLVALDGGQATWTEIGATGNVLNVLGGTNITVNTVANNATVNLNPSIVLAGSLNAGTSITAGTTLTGFALFINNTSLAAIGPTAFLTKSRNGGIIQTGDEVGKISFRGFDGVVEQVSASIVAESLGTIAAGRVPSKMTFSTTPDAVSAALPRVVIDENGTVNINATTGGQNALDATGVISLTEGFFNCIDTSNDAFGSGLVMQKDRNGLIVQVGDQLGSLDFEGYDGAVYSGSARIEVVATGTIAAGSVPGQLKFYTTDEAGFGIPLERVVIDENGTVTINATDGGVPAISASDTIVSTDFVGGGSLVASGDLGVVPLSTVVTNVDVANVPGGGALTIDSQSANPGTQAGFIKIYVGAATAYIPYFTNIAP